MNRKIFWTIIASESIHIFCCVLPTLFSILSLLAGAGMIMTLPHFIDEAHHLIHDYEIPIMVVSVFILTIGWFLHAYSRHMNCSDSNEKCCHEPCAPKKDRTRLFMIIATLLFCVNATVYFTVHRPMDEATTASQVTGDTVNNTPIIPSSM